MGLPILKIQQRRNIRITAGKEPEPALPGERTAARSPVVSAIRGRPRRMKGSGPMALLPTWSTYTAGTTGCPAVSIELKYDPFVRRGFSSPLRPPAHNPPHQATLHPTSANGEDSVSERHGVPRHPGEFPHLRAPKKAPKEFTNSRGDPWPRSSDCFTAR